MRISDWSSDVCSSDLGGRAAQRSGADDDIIALRPDDAGQGRLDLRSAGEGCGARDIVERVGAVGRVDRHADDGGCADRQRGKRDRALVAGRSEEHTSELQSLMRISYAVFCLKKKKKTHHSKPATTNM